MSAPTAFSTLDTWLLARVVMGYDVSSLPLGLSPRAEALAVYLRSVPLRSRELAVRNRISDLELRALLVTDTEQPQPKPPDGDRPYHLLHAGDLHQLPPQRWIIPGEIPESGLCVIFGESGVGKSFITIDYALRVAQDHTVVYIPTEGEGGYKKRVAAWCRHHQMGPGQLYFLFGGLYLHNMALAARLANDLRRLQPSLLIVDTLAMAMAGLDENSARDMGIFMQACRFLIERLGASVLLVHHTNKSGAWIRGSSALQGNADSMIRVTNADDLVLLECVKTKDEQPFDSRYLALMPVALEDGQSLVPVPADRLASRGPGVITPNQRKLLDVLALEVNRDGVPVRELGDVCGLSTGAVHRALSNLMRKDYVHKPGTSYAISDAGLAALRRIEERALAAVPEHVPGSVPASETPFLAHVPAVPASDVISAAPGPDTDGTVEPAEQTALALNTDGTVRRPESYYHHGA